MTDQPEPTCPATYRELPMPDTAYCARPDGHWGRHCGYDADRHYYTWLDGDEGAGVQR